MVHHIHIVGLYTSCRLTVVENFKNYGFKNKKKRFPLQFFFCYQSSVFGKILSQKDLVTIAFAHPSEIKRFCMCEVFQNIFLLYILVYKSSFWETILR